ncbi:hypothetical protein, partial [Haematobacter sp. UBA3484]
ANVICEEADVVILANIEASLARLISAEHNAALATPAPVRPELTAARARIKVLEEALTDIADGHGPNHMSAFCRNTALRALPAQGGSDA